MSPARAGVPGPGDMTTLWNRPAASCAWRLGQSRASLAITVGSSALANRGPGQRLGGGGGSDWPAAALPTALPPLTSAMSWKRL